jgi:hypothetical protein
MANQIDLQPQVLDLILYSGDGFKARLSCKTPANAPIDITGAVVAQIRSDRTHPASPPIASFTVDMVDAYLGIIKLSLTGDQTQALTDDNDGAKFSGVWDVEWDPADDEPRTLCQGKVECVADVSR